jgi:hypothetical protein
MSMKSVLVINAGYEHHDRVTVKHAIRMLVREVAVIEEAVDDRKIGDFPFPKVLRLVRYVRAHWRTPSPKWSKRRLLERDSHRCAYCGKEGNTVDHVVPRSQGGKTTWDNTVTSCLRCNGRKGSRSLEKANMKLLFMPYAPSWGEI